jgi:hypothetical protein
LYEKIYRQVFVFLENEALIAKDIKKARQEKEEREKKQKKEAER